MGSELFFKIGIRETGLQLQGISALIRVLFFLMRDVKTMHTLTRMICYPQTTEFERRTQCQTFICQNRWTSCQERRYCSVDIFIRTNSTEYEQFQIPSFKTNINNFSGLALPYRFPGMQACSRSGRPAKWCVWSCVMDWWALMNGLFQAAPLELTDWQD